MIDKLGRLGWGYTFMGLAFVIAQRSIDPNTKHGTVVVNQDKEILSLGFNGPPRGCNDEELPLTRPEKYEIILHSEEAAIVSAAKTGTSLNNSIFYITGYPCTQCVRKIINVGASRIIYGPVNSNCLTEESITLTSLILKGQNIIVEKFENSELIASSLNITLEYIRAKCHN